MNAHERGYVPANNQRLFRQMVENDIERLIALLDRMDGDCDLEDDAAGEDCGDAEPDDAARIEEFAS